MSDLRRSLETTHERAERIVRQEVHLCVSNVVSALAAAHGEWTEAAQSLSYALADYESTAREAGWRPAGPDAAHGCAVERDPIAKNGELEIDSFGAADWADACWTDELDPQEIEVFEHWAISDWLADKLEAAGEKVDRDFAGLTVWARTTTGQAISMDAVIQRIVADLFAEG